MCEIIMVNVIDAILNTVEHNVFSMKMCTKSKSRANNAGDSLEAYVTDMFANTFDVSEPEKTEKISNTYSYLGNQNNPPDIILKDGDAIEVKKIQSLTSGIALNSSPPKDHLYSDDTRISSECRKCEEWDVKDIMYIIGSVKSDEIKQLSIVYGEDYAASKDVYERMVNTIKEGMMSIPDVIFEETNELGRVNRVDPLGITYLRIRGMWHIENPLCVYDYIYKPVDGKSFNMFVLINEKKYETFNEDSKKRLRDEMKKNPRLQMKDVKIKDPNNPARLKDAKLITYYT